jgi:EutQ-like cupin domain
MTLETKNLELPEDKRSFEHGEVLMVHVGGCTIGRAVLNPGWRWSTDVKPLAGTSSCELAHTAYVISGRMRVRMNDGTEAELAAGDAHYVSPGHDAWIVGDQPCVVIDFTAPAQLASAAGGASRVTCHPCGVEFRVGQAAQLDHLIAAVQQHASGSHGHDVTREHILSELQPA